MPSARTTNSTSGLFAIMGQANGTGSGVLGTTADPTVGAVQGTGAVDGLGVVGTVTGTAGTGAGVKGQGFVGVLGTTIPNSAAAIRATPIANNSVGLDIASPGGNTLGVVARGTRAPLQLVPAGTSGIPSGVHDAGELWVDSVGDLYYCSVAGNPGTWALLNTPASNVGFNFLDPPVRIYDSRPGQPHPGNPTQTPLAFNASRVIDCSSAVPGGASGILFNLTVVNTVGASGRWRCTRTASRRPRRAASTGRRPAPCWRTPRRRSATSPARSR